MKRLLILLCVAGLLAALPMSHLALAGKPEEKPAKVTICHVNSANDMVNGHWWLVGGRVIEVAESAVPAHLAHGDSLDYEIMDEEFRDYIESFGYSLPNANCWFVIYIP